MAIIETKHLTKRYTAKVLALDDLNLSIEKGEIFGLLGPNGAGKTTTISLLCTILRPTRGTAKVNGFDISAQAHRVRKSIGVVFQEQTLDTTLTGRENLELHARLYGLSRADRESRIPEVLELVDLDDRAGDIVKSYSGGMRRRLELGRGLLHRPAVLFLDEPTLGLDPQTRVHIWDYIKRMVKETGTTVVMTTHYMDEADLMCGRIGIIDHGKVIALDTPVALKHGLGGDIIRIRMKAPPLDALKALPFVRKVEVRDGTVSLTVDSAERNLPALIAGVQGVESVELRTPTLDDVFLNYTGRELRPEGGGGGWDAAAARLNQQGGG